MKSDNTRTIFICTILVLIAALSRILNAEMAWYHFTPLVAISLFSGALLRNKSYGYALPLAAYFLSDLYLQLALGTGFYGISQFFVYGGMALVVTLGTFMKKVSALKVFAFTLGSSLLFWLISNLGVFFAGYYGYSINGFVETYLMALPFYTKEGTSLVQNAILGDLICSGVLFGVFSLFRSGAAKRSAIA